MISNDWREVLLLLKAREHELEGNARYWGLRGAAESTLRNYTAAETAFQKAVLLGDSDLETQFLQWHGLGHSQFMVGHIQQSVASYMRAVELKKDSALAWNNLCWSLVQLAQYQQALSACRESVRLAPDYAEAWNSIGHAHLGLQSYRAAIDAHRKAVRGRMDNPDTSRASLYYDLGEAYARANQRADVDAVYVVLSRLDPERADRFRREFILKQR